MIRNIFHTLGSRFIVSILNLGLLLITTKLMGAENKGAISLLVLNLSMASIISGLFGGPSLVYLIPRFPYRSLLVLNYSWSILTSGILALLVYLTVLPSITSASTFFGMALLECMIATHLMILLGREHITKHNLALIAKTLIVVAALIVVYYRDKAIDYQTFESAYLIALIVTFLLTSVLLLLTKQRELPPQIDFTETVRNSFKYGALVQGGNIAQLFNYRLSFYFLELMIHPPVEALIRIGIYSATLQVAEALWQFARSVSTVQYSAVSNLKDRSKALAISLNLGKLNYSVTIIGMLVLLLPSNEVYGSILGAEFSEVKSHLIFLAPGIIALSLSNAFSHYFAGIGLHRFNTQSSVLGLGITIILGYFTIKDLGTIGAAITASVVYVLQTAYQFYMLVKEDRVKFADLLITNADWSRFRQLLKKTERT